MSTGKTIALKDTIMMLDRLKPQMALALPKHMNADRLHRIALTELRQTPKLQECSQESLMKCLMVTSQLGLEPGLLGHVYLIPYGKEAQVIIGYKGMIDLARRSGQIESIEARVIYSNDKCDIRYGVDSTIDHIIDPFSPDRGKPIGYYAVAKLVGGGKQFEFMSLAEIKKIQTKAGPWATHFEEMAKKTVIRRLFKYLPVSVEIQKASILDEARDAGIQREAIDAEFCQMDEDSERPTDDNRPQAPQADTLVDKLK